MLKFFDFKILASAENGQQAVDKYKTLSIKPDVIIMDHRMPIKSGFDAAKEILAINKEQKIVFASADSTIKRQALSLGIEKFIEKPFKYTKLVETIKDLLNESN